MALTKLTSVDKSVAKKLLDTISKDLSKPYIFETVADFKASTILFPDGKTIHLNDRDADFTKITGTGTANTFDIIASTSVNQSIELPDDPIVNIKSFGALNGNTGNQSPAINRAADKYRELVQSGAYISNAGTGNPHHAHGVTLYAPSGIYRITDDIWLGADIAGGDDFDDSVKNIYFEIGAVISSCNSLGRSLDCAGMYGARWQNVCVFGDETLTPDSGLSLARSGTGSPNPSAGSHRFINCKFIGNYNDYAVNNYGSEVNSWVTPEIRNSKAGSKGLFFITADNSAGIVASGHTTVADNSYQSTYAPTITGGDLRYDVDGTGSNALMVCESPSYGPKLEGVYLDLLQTATVETPFFKFNEIVTGSTSEKRMQSVSINNCVYEETYSAIIDIRCDVRELTFSGNSLAGAATDADIVIHNGFALRSPTIQRNRGGSTVLPMTYNTNSTGVLQTPTLNFVLLGNNGFDFIESALTLDGTWREMDLTSLGVPTNARAVSVALECANGGTISNSLSASLRNNGDSNVGNQFNVRPSVSTVYEERAGIINCTLGVIQYNAAAIYTRFRVKVRGYYA